MWSNIKKAIYAAMLIWTVIVLFIVYKNIKFPFVLQFVLGYVICLILTALYFLITISLSIRKANWATIKKILPKFIITCFVTYGLNALIIFFKTGEFKITDKIFISVLFAFCLTFGELAYENKKQLNDESLYTFRSDGRRFRLNSYRRK